MNYRFLKFTTIYDQVKERLLARLPNHEQLSYRELYDSVTAFRFAWCDYFAKHLRELGNETENFFADFEPLQKAWAREGGVQFCRASSAERVSRRRHAARVCALDHRRRRCDCEPRFEFYFYRAIGFAKRLSSATPRLIMTLLEHTPLESGFRSASRRARSRV
jgi:hypothetical protein